MQHPIYGSELIGYAAVNDAQWYCPPHAHQCFELLYVCEGQCRINTSGGTTTAWPHNLVLFRPFQWHEERAQGDLYSVLCLRFPAELINQHHVPLLDSPVLPTVTPLPPDTPCRALLDRIVEEFQRNDAYTPAMIGSYLFQFAVTLQRVLTQQQALAQQPTTRAQATTFQRLLDDHVASAASVRDLARQLHMSESHFCHSVKEALGVAPMTYLREQRLARARVLLHTTTLSIEEIALRLGYDEPTSFFRAFKRATGTTPGAYRQQMHAAGDRLHEQMSSRLVPCNSC